MLNERAPAQAANDQQEQTTPPLAGNISANLTTYHM